MTFTPFRAVGRRLLSGPPTYWRLLPETEEPKTRSVIRGELGVFPVGCTAQLQTHCAAPSRHARGKEFAEVSKPAKPLRLSLPCRCATSSRRIVYSACAKGARVDTTDARVRRFCKLSPVTSGPPSSSATRLTNLESRIEYNHRITGINVKTSAEIATIYSLIFANRRN